jgi:L-fucose mutarotase
MPSVTDVVKILLTTVPVEEACVMDYARKGPYALREEPPVWNDFRRLIRDVKIDTELTKLDRQTFYEAAGTADVCLSIATGEQRIYANLLLTIGVVK